LIFLQLLEKPVVDTDMNEPVTDLATLSPGFGDETHSSQFIFRTVLNALSYPGRLNTLHHDARPPLGLNPVASGVLLALLDSETSLWLSDSLRNTLASTWLQFHTDCTITDDIKTADFVWIKRFAECPALDQLQTGSDAYPDRSAICIIEVESLTKKSDQGSFVLQGPGIKETQELDISAWSREECKMWLEFWNSNRALFPCGVDVFFSDGEALVGLPRTSLLSFLPREV